MVMPGPFSCLRQPGSQRSLLSLQAPVRRIVPTILQWDRKFSVNSAEALTSVSSGTDTSLLAPIDAARIHQRPCHLSTGSTGPASQQSLAKSW
jgi:hypothetical protein